MPMVPDYDAVCKNDTKDFTRASMIRTLENMLLDQNVAEMVKTFFHSHSI